MTEATTIAAVDVGSVRNGKFGWFTRSPLNTHQGVHPDGLLEILTSELDAGRSLALGFECPLYLPLPAAADDLGRARNGEGNRAWSAGAGSGALTTGTQQMTWVFCALGDRYGTDLRPTFAWGDVSDGRSRLMIWEAFVTGTAKTMDRDDPAGHVADARSAVDEFDRRVAEGPLMSDCDPEPNIVCLAGAALLRAGLSENRDLLRRAPAVIRPQRPNTEVEAQAAP